MSEAYLPARSGRVGSQDGQAGRGALVRAELPLWGVAFEDAVWQLVQVVTSRARPSSLVAALGSRGQVQ